jgi:GNAT superfamily N-acetyltransferase
MKQANSHPADSAENGAITCAFLADHPHLAETLAGWAYAEWGHLVPEDTLEASIVRFKSRAVRESIPLCLIALEAGEPVGCVVLKPAEEITRVGLTPWLGALYVRHDRRGRGIAGHLIGFALGVAKNLGLPRLYLSTVSAEALYRRHGWQVLDRFGSAGEHVALMCRESGE